MTFGGYYNRLGEEISAEQYAAFDISYRRVALTEGNGLTVSTVWLGIDHRHGYEEGPPLIFETMVFRAGTFEKVGNHTRRYSTEVAARDGHREVCNEVLGP